MYVESGKGRINAKLKWFITAVLLNSSLGFAWAVPLPSMSTVTKIQIQQALGNNSVLKEATWTAPKLYVRFFNLTAFISFQKH